MSALSHLCNKPRLFAVAFASVVIAGLSAPVAGAQRISVRIGGATPQDSLKAAAEQAHDDTLAFRLDSTQRARQTLREQKARALPVTPELLRTATRDEAARTLLARARAARLAQDSSLVGYDANTYERFSVGLNVSRFLGERLLFRSEQSTHVVWQRNRGAAITLTGARSASPIMGDNAVTADGPLAVPYSPGSDALWVGSGLAKTDVDAAGIVNPIAQGAEAYYTYATGDSLTLKLPSRTIVVRELRVSPRAPGPRVVVGSLWFEVATGQLVRAIYRMAGAEDLTADMRSDEKVDDPGVISKLLQRLLTPSLTAEITAITVDYGLFEGRFWLPTSQTGDGRITVGSIQVPIHLRQHFDYDAVNGTVDVPVVAVTPADTAHTLDAFLQRQNSARRACADTSAQWVRARQRYGGTLPVTIRVPCDTVALAQSKTLPRSIYDAVDTLFDEKARGDLVDNTFGFGREASFVPQKPGVHYGLGYTRYNRIEGFSTAVEVRQLYGPGFSGHVLVRGGFADQSLNGEVGLARSNGSSALSLNGYRRLNAADDWGNPFGLAASLSALFGHDDQTYYRTWGGELVHQQEGGLLNEWRLFGQHESTADQRAGFTIGRGDPFHPNAPAVEGDVAGLSLRRSGTLGEDPSHFRALSDVRVEGVTGTFDYVRAMADLTLDQPVGSSLRAVFALSGGTSGGTLPIQHHWFLGGPNTIRGQTIGTAQGDAYWFARTELGTSAVGFKPVIFYDIGWAGDRNDFTEHAQPISGAGVGVSMLDGLVRFDVAKGIRPTRAWHMNAYFDTRF